MVILLPKLIVLVDTISGVDTEDTDGWVDRGGTNYGVDTAVEDTNDSADIGYVNDDEDLYASGATSSK